MSNIEYELRILEINQQKIIEQLNKLGATKKGEYFFRRHVFETIPDVKGRWVRLRTDGTTTTLTVKQIDSDEVDGTTEWETTVDDFDETLTILNKIGLKSKGYQENKRIEYVLNGTQVCLDTWPSIPQYMEVEGESEEMVIKCLESLGFNKDDSTGMNTEKIYQKYGINIAKNANLSF